MTTRWFVEVSPVDADALKERYCVEALQWQHALQQARKLRGDRGPLSRFNIELLDSGYRATDPLVKLRYMVSKAPGDAPLTSRPVNGASRNPARERSAPPKPVHRAELHQATSGAAAVSVVGGGPAAAQAPVSIAVLQPSSAVAPPPAPAKQPAVALVGGVVPAPPRQESGARPLAARNGASGSHPLTHADRSGEPIPLVSHHGGMEKNGATSAAVVVTDGNGAGEVSAAETIPSLPGLELLSVRREEPTEAIPIVYREFAFIVSERRTAKELERYVRAIWEQVRTALAPRPEGKFVQIAIFDHRFDGRPERPPVAVLGWKDWRGEPVVQIRKIEPEPQAPAALQPPRPTVPSHVAAPQISFPPPVSSPEPLPVPSGPVPSDALPTAPWSSVPEEAAPSMVEPKPIVAEAAPIALVQPVAKTAPAAAPGDFPEVPAATAPPAAPAPPAPVATAPAATEPKPLVASRAPKPPTPAVATRRRGPSEDLISELFEQMHQLHFMADLVGGAEYVLNVLNRMLPCEGVIVHVFDINAREFVVVRAKGPGATGILLQRTPDTFALFRDAFRRTRAMHVADAAENEGFQGGRWERLGVVPKDVVLAAVRQGGRYLGMLEVANPDGDAPFYVSELNAMDYIAEQFASFVATKPIVLDEDAVVPRGL